LLCEIPSLTSQIELCATLACKKDEAKELRKRHTIVIL